MIYRSMAITLVPFVLLVSSPLTTSAMTFGSSISVGTNVDGLPNASQSYCSRYAPNSVELRCSGMFALNGTEYFYDGMTAAQSVVALKGRANLYASRSLPGGTSPGSNQRLVAVFGAWFNDTYIVPLPDVPIGATGFMEMGFIVDGGIFQTAQTLAHWSAGMYNFETGQYDYANGELPQAITLRTSVTYGQPFSIQLSLNGQIDLSGVQYGGYDQQQVSLDLSHTLRLVRVQVLNDLEQPISVPVLSMTNGNYYGLLPVPEPLTWHLLTVGLLGAALLRRTTV